MSIRITQKDFSRRSFLNLFGITILFFMPFFRKLFQKSTTEMKINAKVSDKTKDSISNLNNFGMSSDGFSHIYLSKNGIPEENTAKVIDMMGGIETIIGREDIVILKPNAQWWNQGMTNTNAMKEFIEHVLKIPNFSGEIIIAENHHFPEDNSSGWTTQQRNGDFNYNELIQFFQENGYKNVTKYHWHDGGETFLNMHGGASNGGLVTGPEEGDGYVWRKDLEYKASNAKKTLMNYPVFTSKYSGLRIDLKNGVWQNGQYTDQPLKLINFAALNHHGNWAGVTASIKNYLGIIDMTCGYRGIKPEGYYNFHFIGSDEPLISWSWRLENFRKRLNIGYISRFMAEPIAEFMKKIRIADLNIITADWIGFGSRTDPKLSARTKTILASKDPVALDYFAAKYVLLPATPQKVKDKQYNYYYKDYNDPDRKNLPFRKYLEECQKLGIGTLDEAKMKIHQCDFQYNKSD